MSSVRYAYAGNRDIGVGVLEFLLAHGKRPSALLLTDELDEATEAMTRLAGLPDHLVFRGKQGLKDAHPVLAGLELDYVFGIHYPFIIPPSLLRLPRQGFLNLHPAYLPYNRGWHTPSWALLDQTPAGATLHFMTAQLDMGDIIHQKEVTPLPTDTANSLYRRMKEAGLEVFQEAYPSLEDFTFGRLPQDPNAGTSHRRRDLLEPSVAQLQLGDSYRLDTLLRRLRALTTDRVSEACYFIEDGKKYRITVRIEEEAPAGDVEASEVKAVSEVP